MSIVTVDGAPVDRSAPARMLGRPITHSDRTGGVGGLVAVAIGALAIGGFLGVGAVISAPISLLLAALEAGLAALFLYLGVGFVRDALRDRRRNRRGLRVTYGLSDVAVEEYGAVRRLSLDEPFEHDLRPTRELRRIVEVRRALRAEPPDSALRKAMEWAVWVYIEGPRRGIEPIYVALPDDRQPYAFFASDLREEGDDIGHLLGRGVPVIRLAVREGEDGLEPVAKRSAAARITRPLFG